MQDSAQDMEDKENNTPANSHIKLLSIRQNLSPTKAIHRGLQGPGSVFDFAFASCDSMFSDCRLKLYIEGTIEEAWDVDPGGGGAEEALDLKEPNPGAEHSFDPSPLLPPSIQAEPVSVSPFPEPCAADLPLESLPLESPGFARFLNAAPKDLPVDKKEHASLQQVEEARVREVPVTAVILAAKSTFFMKLFTVGMRETVDKRVVTVHLTAKEEPIMMELLSYIYKGVICPTFTLSFEATLQLLLLADRFGVQECFQACINHLQESLPLITAQEALLYLDVPHTLQENAEVVPLLAVAEMCVVDHFGPLLATPSDPDFLSLSLPGLRAVLRANDLTVESEEKVFRAVILWARHKFLDLGLRREVVATLVEDVRFPWMTAAFIKGTVMGLSEMRTESSRNLVVDALLFMAAKEDDPGYATWRQLALRDSRSWCLPRLAYLPPVKSVFFDIPLNHCKAWSPTVSFQATSGPFCAAGKWFTLNAKLDVQKEAGARFGLFLRLDKLTTFSGVDPKEGQKEVHCQYRFCMRMGAGGDGYEVIKAKSSCIFSEPYHGWGSRDLFRKPWGEIIGSTETYFRDGALQLRADIWVE